VVAKTVAPTSQRHAYLAASWLDKTDMKRKGGRSAFTIGQGQIVANKEAKHFQTQKRGLF
jgi:hypothetical protein